MLNEPRHPLPRLIVLLARKTLRFAGVVSTPFQHQRSFMRRQIRNGIAMMCYNQNPILSDIAYIIYRMAELSEKVLSEMRAKRRKLIIAGDTYEEVDVDQPLDEE